MKKMLDRLLYYFIKYTCKFITLIYFRLKVVGGENLPDKGPFIIAANHLSYLDPIVVQIASRGVIGWITKRDVYEKGYLRFIHRLFRSIPVNGSIDKALAALQEGRIVGIFPEGGRSRDGRLKEAGLGVALLALGSGKTVVPIGINGAYKAFGVKNKFPKPYPITLKIGKPILFERVDPKAMGEGLLKDKRDYIMGRIKELVAE